MYQPIAACTRAETLTRMCPCAICIWLLHPATTSPKMVLTLCNLRWWCFSSANLPIYWCAQAHIEVHCNLHCVVVFMVCLA